MITKEIEARFLNDYDDDDCTQAGIDEGGVKGCINYIMRIAECDEETAHELVSKYNMHLIVPTPQQIAAVQQYEAQKANRPKCPTCGSTNIKRISTTAKVAGALSFGLLSKTARSQFKCNNCGYKW